MAELFSLRAAVEEDRPYLDAYCWNEGMDNLPSLERVTVAANGDGEPVGFISDGDILKRLSPRRESFTDPIVLINRTVTDNEDYEQKLAKVMQMRASEIGAPRPICVSVHANLTDVCRCWKTATLWASSTAATLPSTPWRPTWPTIPSGRCTAGKARAPARRAPRARPWWGNRNGARKDFGRTCQR